MVTKSIGMENRREKESIVQALSLKTKTKNGSAQYIQIKSMCIYIYVLIYTDGENFSTWLASM